MSTATKLRADFLADAPEALEEIRCRMLGKPSKFPAADGSFLLKYWDALIPIITAADDPLPLSKLTDGDIAARVDTVLSQVASGVATPHEGKSMLALLQAGFDLTELPEIIKLIESAEQKK